MFATDQPESGAWVRWESINSYFATTVAPARSTRPLF